MSDNVDWSNRYTYEWSPLAPVQYDVDEAGVVPGEMWKDASGEYSPSVSSMVFQLSIPAITDELLYDLVKRYQYENLREDFIETKHPDFDRLIFHEKDEMKEVFASKGKAVFYVRYFGNAEMSSVIESIDKKIDIISGK